MKNFRDLKVWELGHRLTLDVYGVTKSYPADERFGLSLQMRKAAGSVPMNLAEGCGRGSDADFGRLVVNACGSSSELEYDLILSRDLNYITAATYDDLLDRTQSVGRMLNRLQQRLRRG